MDVLAELPCLVRGRERRSIRVSTCWRQAGFGALPLRGPSRAPSNTATIVSGNTFDAGSGMGDGGGGVCGSKAVTAERRCYVLARNRTTEVLLPLRSMPAQGAAEAERADAEKQNGGRFRGRSPAEKSACWPAGPGGEHDPNRQGAGGIGAKHVRSQAA